MGVVGRERGASDPGENVSMLGETVESAQKERGNYQAAMLMWLAVEVKLKGTSQMWVAAS